MDEEASQAITEEQRKELRRRLADYRANPDEPLVTLADIRRECECEREAKSNLRHLDRSRT